ncbi:membrane protein [Stenotrophomonas rhizophila]|nr:membrane protein [Stenotrophomonas rhizophila]
MWTGFLAHNQELADAHRAPLDLWDYLQSGHFVSATFENWESEFLQMGMYVLLTVSLRQKGSAESRPLDDAEEEERIEAGPTPWAVRKGGLWKTLYGHSLAITFGVLFLLSFSFHLTGSWRAEVDEQMALGQPTPTCWEHLWSSSFWFESFQNWQSEFLAVLALVILTIFLRQKDSPQSKPLAAPHSQTGD